MEILWRSAVDLREAYVRLAIPILLSLTTLPPDTLVAGSGKSILWFVVSK